MHFPLKGGIEANVKLLNTKNDLQISSLLKNGSLSTRMLRDEERPSSSGTGNYETVFSALKIRNRFLGTWNYEERHIDCSNSKSETVFSALRRICTDFRTNLTPQLIDILISLKTLLSQRDRI